MVIAQIECSVTIFASTDIAVNDNNVCCCINTTAIFTSAMFAQAIFIDIIFASLYDMIYTEQKTRI